MLHALDYHITSAGVEATKPIVYRIVDPDLKYVVGLKPWGMGNYEVSMSAETHRAMLKGAIVENARQGA